MEGHAVTLTSDELITILAALEEQIARMHPMRVERSEEFALYWRLKELDA